MRARRSDRGYALLAALVVLLLVSIALAILATALQIRMRLVRQEAEALQLGALSDAALAEALYGITYDAEFPGREEHPFGSGGIASRVSKLGPNQYRVQATGGRLRWPAADRGGGGGADPQPWSAGGAVAAGGAASLKPGARIDPGISGALPGLKSIEIRG